MSIDEIQKEIISEFAELSDWMDRYSLIIDYGNELIPLTSEEMIDANLIDGCQAKVWIVIKERLLNDKRPKSVDNLVLDLKGNSDAILVKGIVALLLRVLSGHSVKEIAEADLYFIDEIHLRTHLSPMRSNGLNAMLDRIRNYAVKYMTTLKT